MCSIAEDVVKGYQMKLYEGVEQLMRDHDVDEMMRDYFIRANRHADNVFEFRDLKDILISMHLWDNPDLHSKKRLQDFYKVCFRF